MSEMETDLITVDVGNRLRELRQERNLSMRAVARASGLSTNALSMIERGKASPSVSTLFKIADALNLPITTFFRAEPSQQAVVVQRRKNRNRVKLAHGSWEGLGGEAFNGRVEPFMLELEPDANSGPHGILHSGSEFVYCMKGAIEYMVDDAAYLLEAGDSLIFAAQLRHRWKVPKDTETQILVVMSNFEAGERPSEFHLSAGMRNILEPEFEEDEQALESEG
jgi:transcriptional regulator with XRE-family HTH domain